MLHIDPAREWRGGQRQLELLVRGLAERGWRQRVLCGSPELLRRLDGLEGVELVAVSGGFLATALQARGLAQGMNTVAAHSSAGHGLAVAAGLRPVVHRRVDFPVSARGMGRIKYNRARHFICVSSAVARVMVACGVPEERLTVVYDGVEVAPPAAPAELGPGRIVLAVGALVDHKDHATLAAAAEGLDARVLVAGEGPLRGRLSGTRLELLGQRQDIPALLARADVFVHCSKTEGMGQVVAEALAAGRPVVATAAGGVPEVVGEAGIVVPVGDPTALREGIRRALAGERMAAWDRERFSVERMVEGTLAVYLGG